MRRLALLACSVLLSLGVVAGAQAAVPSWAAPQIRTVVDAGLMAPSVDDFRPDDVLTAAELATLLSGLGFDAAAAEPDVPVTVRELNARLVTVLGLRPQARTIRLEATRVGLAAKPWLGTETIARLVGLRTNHLLAFDERELQLSQPVTRAEAAYSVARILALEQRDLDVVSGAVATFSLPEPTSWQRAVLRRALSLVGAPYVWAGTSEWPQQLGGKTLPGGFDCSGFVWRVYKLEPFIGAPALAGVLRGRTTYAMSAEVPRSARIARADVQPGDVVFFGSAGPRSKPAEVGHMGIYVGAGWMAHSSDRGTTLTPMSGWWETHFAWARRPLAEAGLR